MDADKSQILAIKNYPKNSAIEVEYVYFNPNPKASGSDAVTDARNVSIQVLHTLIAVPENSQATHDAQERL